MVAGLTFDSADEAAVGGETDTARWHSDPAWRKRDVWMSVIVVALVAIVMLYFSNLFFG